MPPLDEDQVLARLKTLYEQQQAEGESTGLIDAELLHDLIVWLRAARARVIALEEQQNRAVVLAAQEPLPASAPGGTLIVKAGDVNLYVGTGAGTPLRKIPTQPL